MIKWVVDWVGGELIGEWVDAFVSKLEWKV